MSLPVSPVDPVGAAAPVLARQVRIPPAQATSEPAAQSGAAPDPKVVAAAIEGLGDTITIGQRTIRVSYNQDIGRVVVQVISEDTGEVIRQVPPEEFLEFAVKFRELLGVLFDEKL